MPILIVEGPDPLSAEALEGHQECILIESEASRLLVDELTRYCRREVTGCLFPISGHRGAGKTTMVTNAFLQVLKASERGQTRLRPLLVQLHGPSLFPESPPPGAESDDPRPDVGLGHRLPSEGLGSGCQPWWSSRHPLE